MGLTQFAVGLGARRTIEVNRRIGRPFGLTALMRRIALAIVAFTIAGLSIVGNAQAQAIAGSPIANPTSFSRIGDTTTFTVSFNTGGIAWNGINEISVGSGYNGTVSNINCNVVPNNTTNQNLTCSFKYTFGSNDTGGDFFAVVAVKIANTTMTQNGFTTITYNAPPAPATYSASANPNPWSLGGQNVTVSATASGSTGAVDGRVLFYTVDSNFNITSSVTTLMTNGSASTSLNIPANVSTVLVQYPGGTYGPFSTTIERFVPVLTLTPTASASTVVGASYSQTNVATNGTAPYTYTRTQGTLPAGTSLNTNTGTVSGTPTTAGNFSYRITVTDGVAAQTSTTVSGTIAKGANTITFPALANTSFTATPPIPAATASSNVGVTYSSTTPSVCTVSGGVISFVSVGICSITASEGGNANYVAAIDVTRSFSVTQGANTINFPSLPNTPFTSTPPTLSASASSNLTVSYSTTTSSVCTVTSGVISFVSAGPCSITASQVGNANYVAATDVTRSFIVTPGSNTITFPALPDTAFNAAPPIPGASASTNLTVTYSTTTGTVCTVTSGGTITFVKAGTCSITASQAGNANFAAATPVTQSFSVAPVATLTSSPNPSIHNQSVRLQAVVSAATAPSGTVTFRETGVGAPLGSVAVAAARYTKVVAGGSNMCGIVSDTTLECWGYNAVGQLGDGTISSGATTPVQVAGLIGVTNVEVGNDHVCAVLSDKTVKCWGNNVYGQVGNTTGGQILSPVTVTGLTDVTSVALGTSFSCALKSDATVACWGRNSVGQLGIGNTTDTNTPTAIPGLTNVTAITAGQESACALKSDGTVSCWGSNQYRQLGDGSSTNSSSPRSVLNLSTATTIDAGGGYQVCALLANATVQCWGRNDYGQLGTGTAVSDQSTPQTVSGITNATSVGSGNGWSCAALAAGNPKCWGFNYYGALAQGFTDSINTARPTPLDTPAYAGAVYFAMGGGGGCAILANDTITCAGENFRGQLGNGRSGFNEITVTPTNVVKTFTKSVAFINQAFAAGTHTLTADFAPTVGATTTSANVVQTVNKLTQTITFPALADTAFTSAPPVPAASASSNLTVTYSTTTAPVCTVTTGGAISFVSAGICSIAASQAGDATVAAATDVVQSFNVTPGVNTITFPALADTSFTSTPPTPGASASSNLTVAYSTTTAPVCTVTNGGTISFVSAGTCSITASQAGNTNFAAATDVTQSFTVTPGANTITFPALANTAFTATPPTPGASASSNLTVAYTTKTAPVCTVTNGGTISFVSAGTCSITASQAGNTNFAAATDVTQSFTVTPGVNTITFPALANKAFTSAPPTLGASASSNLTVSYASTTAPVCTVTGGGAISFVSAGTCSITASQAGNANFAAATDVTQSFTVTPGVNTITFPALANTAFTSPAPIPAAVASSNLTVTYASITAPVCTVTNAGTISFVAAGTCSIRASQAGNANFAAATDVTQNFTVTPGANTIIFPALANTAFTSPAPIPAAIASSNLTVSYASTTAPVCTVTGGGAISFVSAGTCSITASQAGNANFAAATDVTQSFTVTPGANTITFPALANTAFTATPPTPGASASSNLTVTYASITAPVCTVTGGGAISFVSAGTCSITASQTGNANYVAATDVTRSFTVTPGVNTITFPALANTAFTSVPPVPAATASSNLTVTYASTTVPVCTVTGGGVISFVKTGTCSITASQAGNANFAAATVVTRSFNVTPGTNTITFPALANTAFTSAPPVPAATASSNLTVTYASTTAPVCTVTGGGTISFVSAGVCSITASQAGNANFAAATTVTRSFNVTPGGNVITFPALANTAFSATPPVPAATASSNLTVTYASTTAPVCTVTGGGTISFVSAGTCTITASQAGDASFAAAAPVSRSFTVLATVTVVTTSSATPTAFGAPVTFTATVTVPAGGLPTGTVTFKDGAATIGAAALTNGVATLTTATLDVGAHSITAAYEGSQTQAPAVSPALIQTVTKAVAAVTLTVSPDPVPVGNVVTLQAVLTATPQPATAPTGSIVFKDGQTVIGTGTLLAGSATLTTSTLPAGGHGLTADYAGDASFAAATSAIVPLTVERSCNDLFSGATAFAEATGSASGSTATALGEVGEAKHGGDTGAINSVWCKWTAPVAGLVTFDTTGSTFDTVLAVYTGAALGQLAEVAANDNIDPATSQSRVSFQAEQGMTYLIAIDGSGDAMGDYLLTWNQAPTAPSLYASVLPTSRSVLIGSPASAFATIINAGTAPATQCAIALPPGFPGTLTYQTATPANDPAGAENMPADIQPGQAQNFVFAITPTKALNASEVALSFTCANAEPAPSVPGLSRLTLSASGTPTADILAIVSTLTNDGIVNVPLPGKGLYSAAAINIGAASEITASVDDGGSKLPVTVTLCVSDPSTGACAEGSIPAATQRLQMASGGIVTFTVYVEATGAVPFNPGVNRLHLRLKTNDNVTRGSASLAVRTQPSGMAGRTATGSSARAVGNGS